MHHNTDHHENYKQTATPKERVKKLFYCFHRPLVVPYQYVWHQQGNARDYHQHNRKDICLYDVDSHHSSILNIYLFHVSLPLFQILIIPYQHLLNLANVHRMEVTLGIVLVDGVLIEESALL